MMNEDESRKLTINDAMIRSIIQEPKTFLKNGGIDLSKMKSKNFGHREMEVPLVCRYNCRVRVRQNIDRPTNFSIILLYTDRQKTTYIITRYNGDHGRHMDHMTGMTIKGCHIHTAKTKYIRYGKIEGYAEETDRYRDIHGAIKTFIEDMHIAYGDGKQKNIDSPQWVK